jgi:hypothetical protein
MFMNISFGSQNMCKSKYKFGMEQEIHKMKKKFEKYLKYKHMYVQKPNEKTFILKDFYVHMGCLNYQIFTSQS